MAEQELKQPWQYPNNPNDVFSGGFTQESLSRRTGESRQQFSDFLNRLISRGRSMTEEPRLSSEDLFGPAMSRIRDSVGQSANATKQALSRAMMGGGGDASGGLGAQILGVNQGSAEELGATGLQFSRLADQVNRQRQARGDQLLSEGLQGRQNLLSFDYGTLQDLIDRRTLQEQASKQRKAALLGSIIKGVTTIGGAIIGSKAGGGGGTGGGTGGEATGACWVAEELYGKDSPKVAVVRAFLMENQDAPNLYGEFLDKYSEEGRRWAKMVRDHKPTRLQAERLFDELYKTAMMEKAA